jgi:CDP-diacylglycerol--glycerol-3-phosphate 3-phosphatidyltransferase
MFGARIQQEARRIAELIVRPLAAIGLTPNMATFLGLLLNGVTAAVLATGQLRLGGLLVLFAGIFDMFDGALARVQQRKTLFGAFFDSTLDRYSEGLVLLGVLLYVVSWPPSPTRTWVVALTYVAALSSLMVSYTKARAEGLGLECKIGLMARPERVLLLAIGLILGGVEWLVWTMAVLAATSTYTAAQRIVHVWRLLEHSPAPTSGAEARPATRGARRATPAANGVPTSVVSRAEHVGTDDPDNAVQPPTHIVSERSTDH